MGGLGAGIFGTSSDTEPVRPFDFSLPINEPIECRRMLAALGRVADPAGCLETVDDEAAAVVADDVVLE